MRPSTLYCLNALFLFHCTSNFNNMMKVLGFWKVLKDGSNLRKNVSRNEFQPKPVLEIKI